MNRQEQGTTLFSALLALVGVGVVVQLWLLSASVDAVFRGDATTPLHAAIGSAVLFEDGQPHDEAAPEAAAYLRRKEVDVSVHLGAGNIASTVWTCDFSAEYVRINAEYRT